MATTRNRTPDDVRREIEREREQLVRAVAHLRGDLQQVANLKPLLRKIALGTVALTAAIVVRKIARRRRRR